MLATRPRVTELLFMHYSRQIHPEFFRIVAGRRVRRQNKFLTLWITNIGHVMTLETEKRIVTEVITSSNAEMPPLPISVSKFQGGQAETLDFDNGIQLSSVFQQEVLEPKNFWTIQKELQAGSPDKGLVYRFGSNGRFPVGAVSYLNLDTWRSKIRLRAFHTFPEDYTIVQTDTTITWQEPAL